MSVYGRSDLDSCPSILLFLVPVAVKVGGGPPLMGRIVKGGCRTGGRDTSEIRTFSFAA